MGLPLADPVLGLLLLLPGGHHGALELWGTRGGDAAAIRVTPRVGTPFGDQTVVFRPKIPTQGVPEGDAGTTVATQRVGCYQRPGREFRCTPDPDLSPKKFVGGSRAAGWSRAGLTTLQEAVAEPCFKTNSIHFCLLRVGHQPPPLGDPPPGGGNLIPIPSRAHPGACQPLDGLGLGVADEVVVQGDVGLEPQRLLLGGLQQEVGAAVGLVGAAEAWGPLRGRLRRKGIEEKAGKSGLGAMGSLLAALPVPPGSGTAPRRRPGSAGGWRWGAAGGPPLGTPLTPAVSCTWPRSLSPSGYWGLLGRGEITQSPTSPAPTSLAPVLGDLP